MLPLHYLRGLVKERISRHGPIKPIDSDNQSVFGVGIRPFDVGKKTRDEMPVLHRWGKVERGGGCRGGEGFYLWRWFIAECLLVLPL